MAVEISKKKIIDLETSDVLSQLEIVRDRVRLYSQKYQTTFLEFKVKVESLENEDFEMYDDLLSWEGYSSSVHYLENRLDQLKSAKDIIVTE